MKRECSAVISSRLKAILNQSNRIVMWNSIGDGSRVLTLGRLCALKRARRAAGSQGGSTKCAQ